SEVAAAVERVGARGSSSPVLEPLLPALAETVLAWSGGRRRVVGVHDEQSALTAGRLRHPQGVLPQVGRGVPTLAGLVAVDSRDDPRQVADLLAGVARRSPGGGARGWSRCCRPGRCTTHGPTAAAERPCRACRARRYSPADRRGRSGR